PRSNALVLGQRLVRALYDWFSIAAEPVVQRANQSLAEYQRIRTWFVWPEEDFPRTSTQKPRSNVILKTVQTNLGSKSAGSSPLAELLSRVMGRDPGELGTDASLENDLNLSSLDRVELLGALEDRYQMDLSETRFTSVKTVGDLEAMLRGKPPARVRYHYPRWAQRWPVTWIRLLTHYLLMRPAVFLLGWPRIEGRENLHGVRGPV